MPSSVRRTWHKYLPSSLRVTLLMLGEMALVCPICSHVVTVLEKSVVQSSVVLWLRTAYCSGGARILLGSGNGEWRGGKRKGREGREEGKGEGEGRKRIHKIV